MLIFGLDFINNKKIGFNNDSKIQCIDFDEKNIKENSAVFCNDINEILIANALNAAFIIPNKSILNDCVNLAEYYLFDSKILSLVKTKEELFKAAKLKCDAVFVCEYNEKYKEYFL
ncbi:hypothetical protein [Campylobacter canadensis]|uniref:UDP-N-acetylmuramoyl-L-alanine--D-glutamate ligase n=1 Tax=Campylobacter canadensis TaxID=449520 RepID=A0ABS7WRI0_9BACT|nr:hypothetical protein [Campylobacter canadensis]MBZ7986559.1 hypothetical protein [Campylobacter canadensis]MBZ7994036.1 hypothetical protein [Campylobacter canadensis]MBZ7995961.1 hypothetical protein [Campylobacter canadensis]MBZ7997595.1 hypothetical protein [Campylobacter canadensis]MBZ7999367.1 hypothetical protein [Campylobacter canadensis]